ncbi:MAG: hypothetical protein Q8O57_11315, partial [Kiritimatiellota bacterium]|nr:hypothetical protein [Kiritimatiellota bacterium]
MDAKLTVQLTSYGAPLLNEMAGILESTPFTASGANAMNGLAAIAAGSIASRNGGSLEFRGTTCLLPSVLSALGFRGQSGAIAAAMTAQADFSALIGTLALRANEISVTGNIFTANDNRFLINTLAPALFRAAASGNAAAVKVLIDLGFTGAQIAAYIQMDAAGQARFEPELFKYSVKATTADATAIIIGATIHTNGGVAGICDTLGIKDHSQLDGFIARMRADSTAISALADNIIQSAGAFDVAELDMHAGRLARAALIHSDADLAEYAGIFSITNGPTAMPALQRLSADREARNRVADRLLQATSGETLITGAPQLIQAINTLTVCQLAPASKFEMGKLIIAIFGDNKEARQLRSMIMAMGIKNGEYQKFVIALRDMPFNFAAGGKVAIRGIMYTALMIASDNARVMQRAGLISRSTMLEYAKSEAKRQGARPAWMAAVEDRYGIVMGASHEYIFSLLGNLSRALTVEQFRQVASLV